MAHLWARLALLAVVLALASASRPQWQRPNAASVIRWNGCAANDETFSILSIQDGSNPRSTFTHSANVNPVWQIFACNVAVPGDLILKFGREIVVGASAVTRPNSVRLNINSDGVEDLEFNRAGEWVSLTGLTSPKNSFTPMTNTITATLARNNIVSPLASAFTLGNPFAGIDNNVAKHCRNGPKVVKSTSGVYATLFTARNTAATGAVAFLCNYDTDATATAICANGIYRSVTLVSATSTSFTGCTPEANDFEFANGQFVVSTNCGINLCGADFATCVAGTRGGWECESNAIPAGAFATIPIQVVNPIGVSTPTPAVNSFLAVVTLGYAHTFAGNNYGFLHIHTSGYVVLTPTAAVPPAIGVGTLPAGYPQTAANAYYPIFHSATLDTSIAGASIVYQVNNPASFTVQFRSVGITGSTSARVTAEAIFTSAAGTAAPRYFSTGDAPAGTTFQSSALAPAAPRQFGCDAGTLNSAILPFQTTAFSVFGFEPVNNRFRFLQYNPTGFTSVYSPLAPVPVLESALYFNSRCCKAPNVRIAAAQSGTNGFVTYVARRGSVIEIMVRFVTQTGTNWGPSAATPVALSGFVGVTQTGAAEENVLIRGIAATYVPTGTAGVNVPFIVISKQTRSCRLANTQLRAPGTNCGLAFEYLIAVCSTPTCTGAISWRIVAESSLLTSGNLAERYVAGSAIPQNTDPRPMPDLLSLSISPKTNLPVLALGSTGALPTLFECLDFKCDAAQVTVGDDYLAGHFGEGFVVAGQSQLTLVSQAAWGIAAESKPYAQRWTSFTTSPDGQIMCNPTNVGKSFTVAGRVYLCTRLPRTPFSAYVAAELAATTPIASALFTWAEVGGRLRLHVTENSA